MIFLKKIIIEKEKARQTGYFVLPGKPGDYDFLLMEHIMIER